jgi:hypothetical protein
MKKKEKRKVKFKFGDKVKILWGKTLYRSDYYADKGEIVGVFKGDFYDEYLVRGFNKERPLYTLTFEEDELILLEEEKQTMKKSDLKQGALVQSRNGELRILLGDKLVDLSNGRYMRLEDIGEDLLCDEMLFYKELSVDKVFQSSDTSEGYRRYIRKEPIKWTWERPHKELTVGEIEKLLGYKVKIIKEETNE